jgi:type I restriction enzyme S subunit
MDTEELRILRRGSFAEPPEPGPAFIRVFKPGQILYGSRRTYLKKVAVADFEGICANTTFVLETKDDNVFLQSLLPFLMYSDRFTQFSIKNSKGSTNPYILYADLARFEFDLPPLAEQYKLADLLWAANATREAYKNLLSATNELVKSQFVEMFGDPVRNEKGWEIKRLGVLGELNRGVSKHRPRNAPELLGGDYPLIQTGEIAAADLYVTEYSSTYSEIGFRQSKMWPKGTLCITIAANIAKTGILGFDACFPDSVVGFISGEQTNQLFIHFWFSFFQKMLEELAPESAQKNINLQTLRELRVIVPPLPLQNRFAEFVRQADKSKFALQRALDELEATYKAILRDKLG